MFKPFFTSAALLVLAAGASAQSINIDFGDPGSEPSPAYAAAGLPGVWNSLGAITQTPPRPLVGLAGEPIPATIYALGGASILTHDHPATSGDHGSLMDDMFISHNNPVDLCLYFTSLQNGVYDVIVYAMSPDSSAHLNRVRVDHSNPGPTWVGGEWPGGHVQSITYSRHRVTVNDGRLFPHSGEFLANYRSGINGLQLVFNPGDPCYPNCDDSTQGPVLNVADFTCFLQRFAAGESYANCDQSTTAPVLNVADFTCFLQEFAAGCP